MNTNTTINKSDYYTTKEVREILGISRNIINMMRNTGKLPYIKIGTRTFLYRKADIEAIYQRGNAEGIVYDSHDTSNSKCDNRLNIIYTRVSTTSQTSQLDKQRQILTDYCNKLGLIPDLFLSDTASGMNEDRKDFNKLLELVIDNKVSKVFITYKDRLTRFGFRYLENIFKMMNTEIVVLNNIISTEDSDKELTDDLITIIHQFSTKMYSDHRKLLKKISKILSNGDYNE